MRLKNLKIKMIFLTVLAISGCGYTLKKVTPMFPNFSKQTMNIWKMKKDSTTEFEVAEQGVPFAEIERRQINKEMEPLVCFPLSQVQEMRRAYENANCKSKALVSENGATNSNPASEDRTPGN